MKILKLLNSKYLSIILIIIFILGAKADDEPIDIWNVDQNNIKENKIDNNLNNAETSIEDITQSNIYNMQSQNKIDTVQVESSLNSKNVKGCSLSKRNLTESKLNILLIVKCLP